MRRSASKMCIRDRAYNAISVDLDSWIKNTLMPSMQNIVSGVGIGVLNDTFFPEKMAK